MNAPRKQPRRRPWLDRARQARRHDLDPRRRAPCAACSTPRKPATPARSIRWPRASCRSPSARRPRPCPTWWTARRPTPSPCSGAIETDTDDTEGRAVATSDLRPAERGHRGRTARLHRDVIAGAAALFRHQDRRRARLRPRPRRRGGRAERPPGRDPCARACVPRRRHARPSRRECGKGTYVRAIARDLGRMLGCLGHVTALRRTRVGPSRSTTRSPTLTSKPRRKPRTRPAPRRGRPDRTPLRRRCRATPRPACGAASPPSCAAATLRPKAAPSTPPAAAW